MYTKKEYATLRAVSNVISGLGWGIVIIFFLIGLFAGISLKSFFAGIMFGLVFGICGIPLIIVGQNSNIFLDQKELLELIYETLSKQEVTKQ